MQKHSGIRRRMLAVGLVGAVGVLHGGPVCAISEQPPTEGILRVAAAIGTPSEVPAQKNDPAAPPRAATSRFRTTCFSDARRRRHSSSCARWEAGPPCACLPKAYS